MMLFLSILAATPALMTLLLIGLTAGDGPTGNSSASTCESPDLPLFDDISSDDVIILYIYNKTTHSCHNALVNKTKNHTFQSRYSCVSQCLTGQGSLYCVGDPVGVANCSNATIYKSMYPEPFNEPYEGFFYNLTSMQCEKYTAVGPAPYHENATNYFTYNETCQEECSGFNNTTIYGNYTTK
uniref:Putative monolaris n=1 Tax=Rhipicephalus pulchellus TaxID=72859 RepID=L7M9J7_RHIPC